MYAYLLNTSPYIRQPHQPRQPLRSEPARPGKLRRWLNSVVKHWQRQRTIAALQELDDRILRDIGLYRGEISHIVREMEADASARRTAGSARPERV
ncbi:DUF1127 domain-containing protein [Sulfitobacter sp. 916]|uniref:DUF1127 domain-containing protein n=1 Tax=unclassified Sulfitobacter TaxID=196795 RepID=UPI0032DEF32F